MSSVNNGDARATFLREQVGLRFGNVAELLRDLAQDEVPPQVSEALLAVAGYLEHTSRAAYDLAADAHDAWGGVRRFVLDAHSQEVRALARAR